MLLFDKFLLLLDYAAAYRLIIVLGIRAGRKFHASLIDALMHFPLSFFEKTPSGRILNRVGKDIEVVDGRLLWSLKSWMIGFFRLIFSLLSICIAAPSYILVLPFFCYIYYSGSWL